LTIILGLEVLEKTHDKIGDPTPIETPSAVSTGAVKTPQPVAAAGKSYPSTPSDQQQPSKPQPARPSRPTYPIESLSPYQNNWTIKARVTQKSEVKRWSNQKGEGQLFSVTLMDETGEIRATGFNAVVDELFNKFQEGKVYYVSKGRVNLAKKKFNSVANDYEISLEKTTEVEEVMTSCSIGMHTADHPHIAVS
jgi:replication factor A1